MPPLAGTMAACWTWGFGEFAGLIVRSAVRILQIAMRSRAYRLLLLAELRNRFGKHVVLANALVLVLASWMPRAYMPRSGMLSGHIEHFVAYGLSAALMLAMLAERHAAWRVAVALLAYAGLLEFGQTFIPGRHAALGDFYFSAAGVLVGVVACATLVRARPVEPRVGGDGIV